MLETWTKGGRNNVIRSRYLGLASYQKLTGLIDWRTDRVSGTKTERASERVKQIN